MAHKKYGVRPTEWWKHLRGEKRRNEKKVRQSGRKFCRDFPSGYQYDRERAVPRGGAHARSRYGCRTCACTVPNRDPAVRLAVDPRSHLQSRARVRDG